MLELLLHLKAPAGLPRILGSLHFPPKTSQEAPRGEVPSCALYTCLSTETLPISGTPRTTYDSVPQLGC